MTAAGEELRGELDLLGPVAREFVEKTCEVVGISLDRVEDLGDLDVERVRVLVAAALANDLEFGPKP